MTEKKQTILTRLKSLLVQSNEVTMAIFLVVFGLIVYSINRDFLTVNNILSVLRASVFYFIIGIGVTYVIISGELDLSVGSMVAFSGLVSALLMINGVPVVVSVIIAILGTIFAGWIIGLLVTRLNIPSLVVTLGMNYSIRGIGLILTEGKTVAGLPVSFKKISQTDIYGSIPSTIIYALVLGVIAHVILAYTKLGYQLKGVGGSKMAAQAVGINVKWKKTIAFMTSGFCAGLTGILMASRISVGSPSSGLGYELYVISAVIIGGTSLFGGIGSITGTMLGALFLSILQNGMLLMHVSPYWQGFVVGLVMITAVGIDQYRRSIIWKVRS
jgi:ribose transport system permease protein